MAKRAYVLRPVKGPHVTSVLKGCDGVPDLPILRIIDKETGQHTVYSYWKCDSLWARLRFLFNGIIVFACRSYTHPPIMILEGDLEWTDDN